MVINSNKRDFKANKLKIGTRGSPLALAQALEVKKEIILEVAFDDVIFSRLTGSGSCIYSVFEKKDHAVNAQKKFQQSF